MKTQHNAALGSHQKVLTRLSIYGIPEKLIDEIQVAGLTIDFEHHTLEIGFDDGSDRDLPENVAPASNILLTGFVRLTIYSGLRIVFSFFGPRDPNAAGARLVWVAPEFIDES